MKPFGTRVLLGDIVELIMGQAPPSAATNKNAIGEPFIQVRNFGDLFPRIEEWTTKPLRMAAEGDILICVVGSIGKVNLGVRAAITRSVAALRPRDGKVDQKYLYYLMIKLSDVLMELATGTAQVVLTKQHLSSIEVDLPSMDVQQRIVASLDEHYSKLDRALARLELSEVLARNLLASAVSSAFLQVNAPKKAIGDFAEVKGGKRLPKGTPWNLTPTAHPYIRSTDIKTGKIDENNLVFVPDDVWDSISRYTVGEGDVLVTIAGTIGQTGVVTENLQGANLTENAAKIVAPRDLVEPHFLEMYLRSPRVSQEMKFLARATTQPKLALYRIEQLLVPLPSLEEQIDILDRLHRVQDAHRVSVLRVIELKNRISELRKSLLHEVFEGNPGKGFKHDEQS